MAVSNTLISNNFECGFTYRDITDMINTPVGDLNNWLAGRDPRPQTNYITDSLSNADLVDGDDIHRILSMRQAANGPEIFKRVKFLSRWEDREDSRGGYERFNNGVHFWGLSKAGLVGDIDFQLGLMTHSHLDSLPSVEDSAHMDVDPIFPDDVIVFMIGFAGMSKKVCVPVVVIFSADPMELKRIANWMQQLQVIKSSRLRVLTFHPLVRRTNDEWGQDWKTILRDSEESKRREPTLDAIGS